MKYVNKEIYTYTVSVKYCDKNTKFVPTCANLCKLFCTFYVTNVCTHLRMKIKVGDTVKNQVTKSIKPKTHIAKDLGISRTWLDRILEQEELEIKFILGIGKSLDFDFSTLFPSLKDRISVNTVESALELDEEITDDNVKIKLIEVQAKYIKLLEAHIRLMEKLKP